MIAPTGTIGLVMDCDTTGIEPDFALVKFKKLAGGGYFKIINRAVPEALRVLGYSEARSPRSRPMRSATAASARRPASTTPRSRPRASPPEAIEKVEKALPTAFDIKFAFNKWTLGEDFCATSSASRPRSSPRRRFDLLAAHRLHQARDRGRQRPRLRRDDGRGRPAPQGRALSGVRLRQPVRHRSASAISRSRATSA